MDTFDVAVVGQGYAGLRAARLARDAGLAVVAFEGVMAGGAVMTVLRLDPSPVPFTTSGPDLGALVAMENMDRGVRSEFDAVTALGQLPNGMWSVESGGRRVPVRHVVLATGTRPRTLDVVGERELTDHGVSHCADCDGWRVKDRDCVVVGAGDAAFQQAAILAAFTRSVTILMRGDAPRARADLVAAALRGDTIRLVGGATVSSIEGDPATGVTAVTYDSPAGSAVRHACAGVFVQVGGRPEASLVPDSVPRDARGAVVVSADGAAGAAGLWAVGSVRSGFPGGLADAGDDARRVVDALLDRDRAVRDALSVPSR